MRRRRVLAALGTAVSAGLAGCGSDTPPATSATATPTSPATTSSPDTPDCGEGDPRIRIENSLDRSVNVSLVVVRRFDVTESFEETTVTDRTVAVPPADDGFSVTTVSGVVPESGWYTVEGTVGDRTASYDWRVRDRCAELLAFQIGDEHVTFVPYGEG